MICLNNVYKLNMKLLTALCLLSCLYAVKAKPTPPTNDCLDKSGSCSDIATLQPVEICQDSVDLNCELLARLDFCQDDQVAANCRKSCHICTLVNVISRNLPGDFRGNIYEGQCGIPMVSPRLKLRIAGGNKARYGAIPWQVSIRNAVGYHRCGGTLISNEYIVTAAHCVATWKTEQIFGYLGKHNRNNNIVDEGQLPVTFSAIYVHPEYMPAIIENDIALLKLSSRVQFTEYIRPACLPSPNIDIVSGTSGLVTGWGITSAGIVSSVLKQVNVPIISNDECSTWYSPYLKPPYKITSNMVCAGFKAGGSDACQEDSGGPLVVRHGLSYQLVGVVSWGIKCGKPNRPGVYTKVSYKIEWMNSIMTQSE